MKMTVSRFTVTWFVLTCLAASPSDAALDRDGLYHNNPAIDAATEQIPSPELAGTTFLDINAADTNVAIFYLTSQSPAGPDEIVSNAVRVFDGQIKILEAVEVTNVVLDSVFNLFHETPSSSSVTLKLWRSTYAPPAAFTGEVFYAPFLRSFDTNGVESDITYLLAGIGSNTGAAWGVNDDFWNTNAQFYGDSPFGLDYSFEWTNSLPANYDFYYFNNTSTDLPQDEAVPGLGGGTFVDYTYATNEPSLFRFLAPPGRVSSAQFRFFLFGGPDEIYRPATLLTNVVVDSTNTFHGLPSAGSITLEVWQAEFWPPSGWQGSMFFAPEVSTLQDGTFWLVSNLDGATNGVVATNNWISDPQLIYGESAVNRDWGLTPTAAVIRTGFNTELAYHNNMSLDPEAESVPGILGATFLRLNYASTTTTFHVLTDHQANLVPGESVLVFLRTSWSTNGIDFQTDFTAMAFDQTVTIPSSNMFHGLPVSGVATVDVWKLDWIQPLDEGGNAITNAVSVFYAPECNTYAGSGLFRTDQTFLLKTIPADPEYGANNYPVAPQLHGPSPFGNDYAYVNQPPPVLMDTDEDGIPDIYETDTSVFVGPFDTGTDPNDPDSDDDGQNDGDEVTAGTDPNSSASVFEILGLSTGTPGFISVNWFARTNRAYSLEISPGGQLPQVYDAVVTGITVAADGTFTTNLIATNPVEKVRLGVIKP